MDNNKRKRTDLMVGILIVKVQRGEIVGRDKKVQDRDKGRGLTDNTDLHGRVSLRET
jgi:hypothetical protein